MTYSEQLNVVADGNNADAPSLSVCIPTYNRAQLLGESLRSLLPQAHSAGILVCVSDNASSDGTGQMLACLSHQYECLRYVVQPRNIGLEANMLFAMSMATTRYILPIGDDEILQGGGLAVICRVLRERDIDLLMLQGHYTSHDLRRTLRALLPPTLLGRIFNCPYDAFCELWDKMPLGAFVMRTDALCAEGGAFSEHTMHTLGSYGDT